MNNSEPAEIVNRLRPRIRVINYSDKENRGVKDKIINKRQTLAVSREPFLEIRCNNRRSKSVSDEIEKGYLRNLKPKVTPTKARKQKHVCFAVHRKNDSQNQKIKGAPTPHPGNIPEWHSDGEDVFIEDEDFGKTVGELCVKRNKVVSPFCANVHTATNTLILIENPEKHVKKPAVKRTLSHRVTNGRKKSERKLTKFTGLLIREGIIIYIPPYVPTFIQGFPAFSLLGLFIHSVYLGKNCIMQIYFQFTCDPKGQLFYENLQGVP